jgi:hypothetical protein
VWGSYKWPHFLADTLSRNPVGLNKESLDFVKKPREMLVAKIDLGLDKTLQKEIYDLSKQQATDPVLMEIRGELERNPAANKDRYMLRNQVLHCKDHRTHPYWRIMLPRQLEYRVIK